MLGYDISWAAFNVIEVMSSSKFTFKRIGYLAASQSFHDETEVLMLTTNMIRKVCSQAAANAHSIETVIEFDYPKNYAVDDDSDSDSRAKHSRKR